MRDDVYYFHQTPAVLASLLIQYVPLIADDVVYEPFRGEGAFYNAFPDMVVKKYTEIEDGLDFKDFTEEYDWVISNPPFKITLNTGKRENSFYTLLKYFLSKARKGVAFLANARCFGTLTPKRLAEINGSGWFIQKIVVSNIKKWSGRYFFIIFEKTPNEFYKHIEGSY